MAPKDKEKMSFIIDKGIFCYWMIPFELKNVKAIYRRFVNNVFREQLCWNMKVYVNYMLLKSRDEAQYLADLKKTSKHFEDII